VEEDLTTRIQTLSDAQLVEAATFYLPDAVGEADQDSLEEKMAQELGRLGGDITILRGLLEEVREDRDSYRYLLTTVLENAANGTEEERERLREALEGTGQNLAVVELIGFAILAASLVSMAWIVNPPRKRTRKVTTETGPDGTTKHTVEEEEEDIPPPVDKLFGWIKDLPGIRNLRGASDV